MGAENDFLANFDPFAELEAAEFDWVAESPGHYRPEKDFVSLVAWQRCRDLRVFFYEEVLPKLPKEETYALGTQIRRAAQSITLNIAEGYGRFHYQEAIQFYRISRGSIYELKDALIIAWDLKVVERKQVEEGKMLIEKAKVALNGYIAYVQKLQEQSKKSKGKKS